MAASGARLVEVGTTNKTYIRDYEMAISDDTVALMKVHPSNYHLVGFTTSVETADLASLAHDRNLLAIEDLGSGLLFESKPGTGFPRNRAFKIVLPLG